MTTRSLKHIPSPLERMNGWLERNRKTRAPPAVQRPTPPKRAAPAIHDQQEQRRSPRALRVPLGQPAQWTIGKLRQSDEVQDINLRGLSIACGQSIPLHTTVKLFVPIPSGLGQRQSICFLEAAVMWLRRGRMGVKFLNTPSESLQTLQDYIAQAG